MIIKPKKKATFIILRSLSLIYWIFSKYCRLHHERNAFCLNGLSLHRGFRCFSSLSLSYFWDWFLCYQTDKFWDSRQLLFSFCYNHHRNAHSWMRWTRLYLYSLLQKMSKTRLRFAIKYLACCCDWVFVSDKFILLLYHVSDFKVWEQFLFVPIVLIERHEFYEPDFYRPVFNEFHKVAKFVVVKSFHSYYVNLDRIEIHLDCFINSLRKMNKWLNYFQCLCKTTCSSSNELIFSFY